MILENGFIIIDGIKIDVRFMPSGRIKCWKDTFTGGFSVSATEATLGAADRFTYVGEIDNVYDPELHFAWHKEQKHLEIIEKSNNAQTKLMERYSQLEVLSWDIQEKEALILLNDSNAEAPLLRSLADGRGIEIAVFRDKVLSSVSGLREATKSILLKQQKYEDEVKKSLSKSDLDNITINF